MGANPVHGCKVVKHVSIQYGMLTLKILLMSWTMLTMYRVNDVLDSTVHTTLAEPSSVRVGHRFANRGSGVITGASQGGGARGTLTTIRFL